MQDITSLVRFVSRSCSIKTVNFSNPGLVLQTVHLALCCSVTAGTGRGTASWRRSYDASNVSSSSTRREPQVQHRSCIIIMGSKDYLDTIKDFSNCVRHEWVRSILQQKVLICAGDLGRHFRGDIHCRQRTLMVFAWYLSNQTVLI